MIQVDVLPPPAHELVLTGVGRFAMFADAATIARGPDGVRMRSFQVVEEDFTVGTRRYQGGWSWWRFDCEAGTADRLDFASVAADGSEGPATPEGQPAYPAVAGGDAAGLLAVACQGVEAGAAVATTLDEAVRIGRARLGD
jgi:hypothetical protein